MGRILSGCGLDSLKELTESEQQVYRILTGLHSRWTPHRGQISIGHALFYKLHNGKRRKNIFVVAGRNFGKTELMAYSHWRYSQEYPQSQNYIFEPFQKQGREILWASRRLQDFGDNDWLSGEPNNTEMRITFNNGSFIKVEGSDNVAAMAGIKPKGLIGYDEFKDHRIASINNFEPNRAAFDVPALFIGTPPEFENHFTQYMELAKNNPDTWDFFHAPTWTNPFISAEWLRNKERDMIALGQEEDWLRDYGALFVVGGKKTIYPWILKAKKWRLDEILPKDLNKWKLIISCDPASTSVFGVVFGFWNEYAKRLIIFDEIYEDNAANMTSRKIYQTIKNIIRPWESKVKSVEWVYDEAAAWFLNEMSEVDKRIWLYKSSKSEFGIEGYINLVRNVMNHDMLQVTGNCKKWWWEHEKYQKDEKGRIPDKDDHLINSTQYLCGHLGLDFSQQDEPKMLEAKERRFFTPFDDYRPSTSYLDLENGRK